MGFFKRLVSADFRAAVAAEAAGDLDLAAERYALAGEPEAAVRVHQARAERAPDRAGEIDALRDALHWAAPDSPARPRVCRALGGALLAKARAEGVATEQDKKRVRQAAQLLEDAGDFRAAGEAFESVGDDKAAARAYRSGGLVIKMEDALAREDEESERGRAVRESFADYELAMAGGDRDGAIAALRVCVEAAERKGEYRRLLDDLESRLIAGGRVELRVRGKQRVTIFAGPLLAIGRDPLCDLILRSGGVSRRHAELLIQAEGTVLLRDAGSRNGTLLAGMPISGSVPLVGEGSFALGDQCEISFKNDKTLVLRIDSGLDSGTLLVVGRAEEPVTLPEELDIDATLVMVSGRPLLLPPPTGLHLNGERVVHARVQLLHGDALSIAGIELEVL